MPGGKTTNKNGLSFEAKTIFELPNLISSHSACKNYHVNNNVYSYVKKNHFISHLLNIKAIKYSDSIELHGTKRPDECIIDNANNRIMFIEKKFQTCQGSVCEKLQTAPFKKTYLNDVIVDYIVEYIYVLSPWFRDNCEKELEYLHKEGIFVLIIDDVDYSEKLNRIIFHSDLTVCHPQSKQKKMKPFLKWVGGKTQIIEKLSNHFPDEVKGDYHEWFLGGGSVLFHILDKKIVHGNIYVYDLNRHLINLYKCIKDPEYKIFVESLFSLRHEYDTATDKKEFYYKMRKRYNEEVDDSLSKAVLFLFLNKTGFRGMYRENKKGDFNIPFGNYKCKLEFKSDFDAIHKAIKDVHFIHRNFKDIDISTLSTDDFVYLDPPYYPETKTASFVGYVEGGFNETCHTNLFNKVKAMDCLGIKVCMSNSCAEEVKTTFEENVKWNIELIEVKRRINPKNPGSKTHEVIITN